jgi:predicted branched-subunit amino acid permease
MLQRIQSIYLLVAALVIAALFIFPLVHNVYVNGQTLSIMVTGTYQEINGERISKEPFTALTVGTAFATLLPLIVIFMYNNRKRQIAACYGTMVALIAYSYWVAQTVKAAIGDAYLSMSNYGIGLILLSLSLVFIIIAQKSIQRDEKLVRSADRLR